MLIPASRLHHLAPAQVRDRFGNATSAPEGALTAVLDSPGKPGGDIEPPKSRSGLGNYELGLEPVIAGAPQRPHVHSARAPASPSR